MGYGYLMVPQGFPLSGYNPAVGENVVIPVKSTDALLFTFLT